MLNKWGKPTWSVLAKTLDEIGQNGIAEDIRTKYATKHITGDQSSSDSSTGCCSLNNGKLYSMMCIEAKSSNHCIAIKEEDYCIFSLSLLHTY